MSKNAVKEAARLRRALRNLVAMNLRLDPTDESRPQVKAALRELHRR